jgi:hypothetical protein
MARAARPPPLLAIHGTESVRASAMRVATTSDHAVRHSESGFRSRHCAKIFAAADMGGSRRLVKAERSRGIAHGGLRV